MSGSRRLGYVVSMFPRLSETFILGEILELERRGWNPIIFTRKTNDGLPVHGGYAAVRGDVLCVRISRPRDWPGTLLDHAVILLLYPRRWLRGARMVLRRRRWSSARKFLVAGRVARNMLRRGLPHLHAHFAADNAKIARMAARLTGATFSFTAHAKDIWVKTPPKSMRSLLGEARFAVTICRYNQNYLAGLAPDPRRLFLIYNGLDLSGAPLRTQPRAAGPGPWELLAVGRLVPKKGFQLLPEVCRILTERGMDVRIRVVGDGGLRPRLEAAAGDARLRGRLRLEGACSQEILFDRYFKQADLLIVPSQIAPDGDRDGIPTVILEALGSGVPVVATAVAGIPEVIVDRKTGILVEPGSSIALADGVEALLKDPALGLRLAVSGAALLRSRFNLRANVAQLAALFEGGAI